MTSHFDAIIIGQGLAGTALAWTWKWSGARVLVLDRETTVTASKIAAGLITPITGQKLVTTWRHMELWPAAVAFYRRFEAETGTSVFRQPSMVRLFADEGEVAIFERRRAAGAFDGLINQPVPLVDNEWFFAERGGCEMCPGGQLDIPAYLKTSRAHFAREGGYLPTDVDVSREIEFTAAGVRLQGLGVSANAIFFCQGFDTRDNPWFRDVQFKPAKGEILTLRIPGLAEHRVIHRGIWLAPVGSELFRAGSTYNWNCLDIQPTSAARDEIAGQLREFLRLPIEVVSHQAAVRPIHRNQYPVIGRHPLQSRLGYFNGLGSKGSLHAPFFARQLVSYWNGETSIDPDVDLNRKTKWHGNLHTRPLPDDPRATPPIHVERPRKRSLTDQAQDAVREVLQTGDTAIDATTGNGHDTQFLAERVGTQGLVFGFDIQSAALEKTKLRLADAKLPNVVLINQNHNQLKTLIPPGLRGGIAAVMFNLGYLPGGDRSIVTHPESTRTAITAATEILRPGGLVTILAYTGHGGGANEAEVVESVLKSLSTTEFEVTQIESQPGRTPGPRLFLVKRRQ